MALASRVSGVGRAIIDRLEQHGGDCAVRTATALAEAYKVELHALLRKARR